MNNAFRRWTGDEPAGVSQAGQRITEMRVWNWPPEPLVPRANEPTFAPEMPNPGDRSSRIVGLDVATQPGNVGVTSCRSTEEGIVVDALALGETWEGIDAAVGSFVEEGTLIALDAPLGWPAAMTAALAGHRAGGGLSGTANAVFRRRTDDVVAEALGKRPLDVGADRIARTAHAALGFLARLREAIALPVPLAWRPGEARGVSAIEVYPAGTLAARGLPSSGYKGASEQAARVRSAILAKLQEIRADAEAVALMKQSDHALDAVLCAVAAFDFLHAPVLEPDDLERAGREGWIWVRSPAEGPTPSTNE